MTIGPKPDSDFSNSKSSIKVSVVTVCRNAAAQLDQTIASVDAQSVRNQIEYIVVDGASTDGTIGLIEAAADSKIVDRWLSEKDTGIYDAMNKAVGLARGEWVLFMNSADVFETNDAIEQILPFLSVPGTDAPDLIYGDCIMVYPDGKAIYDTARKPVELKHRMICSHQSLFARRALLISRPFDTQYTICADYSFLLGAWMAGARLKHVATPIARVQLESYSFLQITQGQRQKRRAAMALRGYSTRWRFDLDWIALAAKHLIKRTFGLATLRNLERK